MITNSSHSVLYTGVTSDLQKRIYQHIQWTCGWFSKRYNVKKLIWYAECITIKEAIEYEKILKWWMRKKKIDLIEKDNPGWKEIVII